VSADDRGDEGDATPTLDVDVTRYSGKDRDFLAVLDEHDGAAGTSTLREESGLTRQQIHYRFDSLAERRLIEVDRAGHNPDYGEENVARLTDRGRELLDAGLLDNIQAPNENLEALGRRMDKLRTDLNQQKWELKRKHRRRVRSTASDLRDEREERLGDLEGRLLQRIESMEETVEALADRVEGLET
jgi:DNA-binding MarR family transcriptional regulator